MKWWHQFKAWRIKKKVAYLIKHGEFKLTTINKSPNVTDETIGVMKFEILEPKLKISCGVVNIEIDKPAIKIVRDWYSNVAMEFSKEAYKKLMMQRKHNQVPK